MEEQSLILEMKDIRKVFPGVIALDHMQLQIRAGEVHALLGENGAGKSTLIKILAGIHREDGGEIRFEGTPVHIESIMDSQKLGISVVHQELSLCDNMTVAENIFLGKELTIKGFLCRDEEMIKQAKKILDHFNISIDPRAKIGELSIAQQQMVEIARAMSGEVKLLILDEPTGTLTNREVDKLFDLVETLKKNNVAVIYISHRLEELFRIADKVTVLRDGVYIRTLNIKDTTYNELVNLLVGREMKAMYPVVDNVVHGELMRVSHLSRSNVVKDCSFVLNKGEILGFYGLVGSGRTEIMRMIYGIDKPDSGDIYIEQKKADIKNVETALGLGISMVPENRKEQGLILIQGVDYNITISVLKKIYGKLTADAKMEDEIIDRYIKDLSIKTPSRSQVVKFLSGGNQQKVVLSKNLATNPKILILDEPTRGIDVGAKKEIYDIIADLAKKGVSIIMVSSEMPEIIHMCNRVIVMHEGSISGVLSGDDINEKAIIRKAMGEEANEAV